MKPGEILAAKYRLEKRLGIGGMGEVWSATNTGTGREFAIKILHAHAATSATARQRFSREAQASSKINHPAVIDVFDVGESDDGSLYLVMELLDGVSLDDVLHAATPITVADFLTIMLEVVRALGAAHAVGVVHRDIKPANIFLHRDRGTGLYAPKVLDFGISKFAGNEPSATRTGAVIGSPRYMSPEQTRSSANVDHRSDLWSFGVVLFEGLTGTFPHEGDSFSSLVVSICTEPPRSIDRMAPHLPEALRAIVRDCLKPMDARMVNAEQLAARIESTLLDPSLGRIALPPAQHPLSEAVKTVSALRLRPASVTGTFPSVGAAGAAGAPSFPGAAMTSGTYPASGPASTSPSPSPSSQGFIPTAQTLPLDAVMQLQEQLKEHLKAQGPRARGGTLAMPTASQFEPLQTDPLKSTTASSHASRLTPMQPAPLTPVPSPPTLSSPAAVAPAPLQAPAEAAGSGKTLRILAVVLALVLIGIVVALVSTLRSS